MGNMALNERGEGMVSRIVTTGQVGAYKRRRKDCVNPGLEPGAVVYHGVVKTRVCETRGFGFIECTEVSAQFGRDGFLHVKRCPWVEAMNLQVGERVQFNMALNERGERMVSRIVTTDRQVCAYKRQR